MTICAPPTNKDVPHLYKKLYGVLQRHARGKGRFISFKECRQVLSWKFSSDRDESFEILYELQNWGWIKIVPFHGVKLLMK